WVFSSYCPSNGARKPSSFYPVPAWKRQISASFSSFQAARICREFVVPGLRKGTFKQKRFPKRQTGTRIELWGYILGYILKCQNKLFIININNRWGRDIVYRLYST